MRLFIFTLLWFNTSLSSGYKYQSRPISTPVLIMDTLEPNRSENVSEDTQNSPTSSKTNQTSQMQMDVEGMENPM